jgi:hypothetical protein
MREVAHTPFARPAVQTECVRRVNTDMVKKTGPIASRVAVEQQSAVELLFGPRDQNLRHASGT